MNSFENYIWAKTFNVPEKAFHDWKQKNSDKSFLFWALTQKIIDRKKYFKWASDFYNTPLVENLFFEQNLMNRNQWNKIKGLQKWNTETVPVYIWEDIIFVAGLEVPEDHVSWSFKHRFVLVTDIALRMQWKQIKDFNEILKEPNQKTGATLKDSLPEPEEDRFSQSEDTIPERNHEREEESRAFYMKDLTMNGPPEEVPKKIDEIQWSKIENKKENTSKIVLDFTNPNIKKPLLRKKPQPTSLASKTKLEQPTPTKPVLSKEATKTGFNLASKTKLEQPTPTKPVLSKEATKTGFNLASKTKLEQPTPIKEHGQSSISKDKNTNQEHSEYTSTQITLVQEGQYSDLFEETKTHFITSLILKHKNNLLFPIDYSGLITTKIDKTQSVANFDHLSIFKTLNKGYSYHGLIIDMESNKRFFKKMGWPQYPKHVTAVPIKDETNQIDIVFMGFAKNNIDQKTIKDIEQKVLDYFSNSKTVKQAA